MVSSELQALLDAAVDAIVVIDERGSVTTFNAAAEQLFGHAAADVVGRNIEVLMPEPYRSQHGDYIRRYLDTGEAKIIGIGREVTACRANGDTFPIALSVGEARAAGGRHFVGIIRDLTEQRAAEQRARSVDAKLSQAARVNLMGEMAAGIAHEINQPLSAIATYAQTAKRVMQREPPDLRLLGDICARIDEQALRAGQIIDNLRKFIRKKDEVAEPLDVNRTIAEVLNLIEADASAEGIPVKTRYGEDLPQVRGVAVQLQQVLLNLTRNSVDAMRDGLHKERGIAIATDRNENGAVRITVADHGHGVPGQLVDEIFHPFVTTKREGLGVGLAISRSIVQSCGGSLKYRDNPRGGAVFVVELPASDSGQDA
jgi:two-component system sensor kinase FixL